MTTRVLLAIVIVLVAGCGDDDNQSTKRPTTGPSETSSSKAADVGARSTKRLRGPYTGSWSARLSSEELAAGGLDPRLAGEFRLELRRNGTYTTFQELDGESRGRYGAGSKSNQLVFGRDEGCEQGGFSGTGVYRWSVKNGALRLRLLGAESGGCTGRTQSLTFPQWKRQ